MGYFDYLVEEELPAIGSFVKVPFRSKTIVGIVWSHTVSEIPIRKLKKVEECIDLPVLPTKFIQFIEKVSEYNLIPLGSVLKMVIPFQSAFKEQYLKKLSTQNEEKWNINLPPLAEAQQRAVNQLTAKIDTGYSVTLLDGVTGSGKTEVYFDIIAKILQNTNGQVLILLPEILLSTQLMQRFKHRFGFEPNKWNSGLTEADKRKTWLRVKTGTTRLVVGARSALFLPFRELKLIVIDEEHEASYKQEDGPIYHARDMAILRAFKEQIPAILASATPSLESLINCKNKKYEHIILPNRYGEATLPTINIIDLRADKPDKKTWLSTPLRNALATNFERGEQSLLFLNRRGYAPLTLCSKCGFKFTCPDCSTWLVEHKYHNQLECHHCGYHIKIPAGCPSCENTEPFVSCGPGVERIEEELTSLLPQARILLVTTDTITNAKQSEEALSAIINGKIDVIIGTQMVAKGHHFPNLTLVGVVDGDLGLAGGDLRAAERSYQLLHQVGGRAGRSDLKGQVIIQTYNPDNTIMRSLLEDDRENFMEHEYESRRDAHMPPFVKLAAIILSGYNEEEVRSTAKGMVRLAPQANNIHCLGPVPAILSKLRNRYRYRILVKAEREVNIQKYLIHWLSLIPKNDKVRIKLDIDPYNFF
jgi:primosomal protein N' (replication factor Y)